MKTLTAILVTAVVIVSLAANAVLINERLDVKFYRKGLIDGQKRTTDSIIQEIQKNNRLNVQLPNGRKIVMEAIPTRPVPPKATSSDPSKVTVEPVDPNK